MHATAQPNTSRCGRDEGALSARNSSKGALVAEAHAVFRALDARKPVATVREACLEGKILRQRSRATRRRIWQALFWRFFAWNPPRWVLDDLAQASRQGPTSPRFTGLLLVHYARRDRFTFDFVTGKLWYLRKGAVKDMRRSAVLDFLEDADKTVFRWHETTRKKLAGNVLSALRDLGLLAGVQRKRIQRPVVPPEVALHLCRLLSCEGLRGRALLEAADWRLFLWDLDDTARALAQVAQREAIRFERAGRTVVLEVPLPGGGA